MTNDRESDRELDRIRTIRREAAAEPWPCPVCHAREGEPCCDREGIDLLRPHAARRERRHLR